MMDHQNLADRIVDKLVSRLNSPASVLPEYLSPEDASIVTGIPVRQLEAMRSVRKGPPYFKLGHSKCSRVRYKLADLRAWIEREGPVE